MSQLLFSGVESDHALVKWRLDPADIIALSNTFALSFPLVAAPGPNQILIPIDFYALLSYQGVAYTGGAVVNLAYSNGSQGISTIVGVFNNVNNNQSSFWRTCNFGSAALFNSSAALNSALALALNSATPYATGNSPLLVTMRYRVDQLS